jgi:AraC-like DNA-binding protein
MAPPIESDAIFAGARAVDHGPSMRGGWRFVSATLIDSNLLRRHGPAGVITYPAGSSFGPRRLADYELLLVVTGSARLRLDQHDLLLAAGSVMLSCPGAVDHYRWDALRPTTHYWAHFDLTDRSRITESWCRHMAADPLPTMLFRRLVQLDTAPHRTTTALATQCLTLLLNLTMATPAIPAHDPLPVDHAMQRAITAVRETWARDGLRPISRRELARLSAVSEAQLSRLFRQHTGTAPVHALEGVRLIHAVHLLSRSNLTIAAVAVATGFTSPFHLSRRCSALLGIAPSSLRDEQSAQSRLAVLAAPIHGLAEAVTRDPTTSP